MTATRNSHPHTMIEVAELVRADGRLWPYWSAITFLAICWAESGGDAFARPVVLNETSPAHLSLDVGLMQINTCWHGHHELSDLLDPSYNVAAAIDIALAGKNDHPWRPRWTWWSAYNAGAHNTHLSAAYNAIRTVQADRSTNQ